jgi:hypothetical protein
MADEQIKINGEDFVPIRLRLRKWVELDGIRQKMEDAISQRDFNTYFECIVRLLGMASSTNTIQWDTVAWFDTVSAYALVIQLNQPTRKFPILSGKNKQDKKLPWEYDGRTWYFWLHIFASNYGWSEEVIANLDIDDAIGLYQEIEIADQMQKEWEWGLGEIAYPYNSSTKKSEFKPLERPDWMLPITPKPVKMKIPKGMIPVGVIIDLQGDEAKKRGI